MVNSRKMRCLVAFMGAFAIAGAAEAQTEQIVNPFNPVQPEKSSLRQTFYTEDQGSRLMPAAWFRALRQPNGQPFMADSLARFGYLPSPFSTSLPIGFTESRLSAQEPVSYVGMTCAACHTRRITVGTQAYIIEGGPAFADLQKFMVGLDIAVSDALNPANFDAFAASVLGSNSTLVARGLLRQELSAWHERNHKLTSISLPAEVNWGPGRADAIQMIFNRVTGLGIGGGGNGMIEANIRKAEAPTRYPFLWNAHIGEKTQWMAFAPNGNVVAAYLRNFGQSLGVFAHFRPKRSASGELDYSNNSINSSGLIALEGHLMMLRKPDWPLQRTTSQHLAALRGQFLWGERCASCHEPPAASREANGGVGTDTRQLDLLDRRARSGVLEGQSIPGLLQPLGAQDTAMNILKVAVVRTALTPDFGFRTVPGEFATFQLPALFDNQAFIRQEIERVGKPSARGYEARELKGIWAAAPYLHNGSVATLTDLLKPSAERAVNFEVGPAYDMQAVGLAKTQPGGSWTMRTTGCEDLHSGNSRCGHEYGIDLLPNQKQDLLEFLKVH